MDAVYGAVGAMVADDELCGTNRCRLDAKDEVGFGSGREAGGAGQHRLTRRQMREQRGASIGIEFGEHVVEQKDRR